MTIKWIHIKAKGSGYRIEVDLGVDPSRLSDHPILSVDMDELEVKFDGTVIVSAKEPEPGTPYESLHDVVEKQKAKKRRNKKSGTD